MSAAVDSLATHAKITRTTNAGQKQYALHSPDAPFYLSQNGVMHSQPDCAGRWAIKVEPFFGRALWAYDVGKGKALIGAEGRPQWCRTCAVWEVS